MALVMFQMLRASAQPNQVSTDLIVNHTSATSASGTASASTTTSGFDAWQAFDGVTSGSNNLWFATVTTGWLQYDFGSAKTITRYDMTGVSSAYGVNRSPNTWTFEGSNDAASWTTLDTKSGISWTTNETKSYTISASTYRYFRVNVTAIGAGGALLGIQELRLFGY